MVNDSSQEGKVVKQVLVLLAKTLGIGAAIGAGVSLVGYLFGWRAPSQFSNALTLVGVLIMGLGVISVSGGYQARGDFKTLYAETAGNQDLHQRSQRIFSDLTQNFSAVVYFILIGFFIVLAGFLVNRFG